MLRLNINKLFKARLISKPGGFLMQNGFGRSTAFSISTNRIRSLSPDQIEKLCIAFRCTPNDLFEFTPTSGSELPESHPLNQLKKSDSPQLSDVIQNLSIEQLKTITENINK